MPGLKPEDKRKWGTLGERESTRQTGWSAGAEEPFLVKRMALTDCSPALIKVREKHLPPKSDLPQS